CNEKKLSVTHVRFSSNKKERRNQHPHNNNNTNNNTNGQRVLLHRWGTRANDTQRSGRTESLTRQILDSGFRRPQVRPNVFPSTTHSFFGSSLEPIRVNRNDEEPDANVEIPGNSEGEANVVNTTIPPSIVPWIRSTRRLDTTSRHRTATPTSTSAPTSATTHTSRSSSTNNNSTDEQMARRIQ
ncbi:5100_t:CDS:2, partial [Acaulospora colombiana]